jgi:hypothetical protein
MRAEMKRLLLLTFAAVTISTPLTFAHAGQRIGNSSGLSAPHLGNTTRQVLGNPSYNSNGVPIHRLGNFEYYNNGMVLPRLGNSCLTPNGMTFCP